MFFRLLPACLLGCQPYRRRESQVLHLRSGKRLRCVTCCAPPWSWMRIVRSPGRQLAASAMECLGTIRGGHLLPNTYARWRARLQLQFATLNEFVQGLNEFLQSLTTKLKASIFQLVSSCTCSPFPPSTCKPQRFVQHIRDGQSMQTKTTNYYIFLTVKLIEQWLQNPKHRSSSEDNLNSTRLVDNNMYHFCIFSVNVLATSVVVYSTFSNANHPQQLDQQANFFQDLGNANCVLSCAG